MKWRVRGTKIYNKSAACFSFFFFAKPFHSQRVKQTVYKQVIVLVVMNATALIRYSVTWDAKEHHLHISTWLLFNK